MYLESQNGSRGDVPAPGHRLDVGEMSREPCVKPGKLTVVGVERWRHTRWKIKTELSSSPWHDSPETSPLVGVRLPQWLGLFFSHSSGYWSYWPGLGQEL